MVLRIVVWVTMLIGGTILGFAIDLRLFKSFLSSSVFHIITLILGLFLINLVFRASRNTGRILAQLGREGNVPRMETNKLVTEDIYACMRHPMHLGLLFFPLAVALIIGSLSFIIFIAPFEMILMILMIKLFEEPEAIKKFGNDYLIYMKKVPMFNLRIECLRKLLKK
ncbi:hypothetical protein BMS3Abin04_00358 [bacterium BMS3Abin04]|nr:hypothetical protein BMS3Abin04_00358 [bacterium BMS3Abin04]